MFVHVLFISQPNSVMKNIFSNNRMIKITIYTKENKKKEGEKYQKEQEGSHDQQHF